MPLDGRYQPSDLRKVISTNLTPQAIRPIAGGIDAPSYYTNDHAIVLDAATDTVNPRAQQLQTIKEAFETLSTLPQAEKRKPIILPVTEEQKILGLFPRNHWVTLHYDPQTNKATVLDSRPWIVSFLYPSSAMNELLIEGLSTIYGAKKAQGTRFEIRYQGVQNNDTHCGAWTSRNIMDLAGANPTGTPTTIEQQITSYTEDNEPNVIEYNKELVTHGSSNIDVHSQPVKPSLWQRFLNFIGFNTSNEEVIHSNVSQPESTSWSKIDHMLSDTPTHSTHSAAQTVDDWDMMDEDDSQNTNSQAQSISAVSDNNHQNDAISLDTNSSSMQP